MHASENSILQSITIKAANGNFSKKNVYYIEAMSAHL